MACPIPLFTAIVAPQPELLDIHPLADNLAPQSFFNAVGYDPLRVISAGDMKDSIRNVEDSGVLAISVYLKP